jgi:hypothetical protein
MYDEYERALTDKRPSRMGPLGWLGLTLAGFLLLGAAGAVFGVSYVRHRVADLSQRWEEDPAQVAAAVLARFDPEIQVLNAGPDGEWQLRDPVSGEPAPSEFQNLVDGSLTIHGSDGDVTVDLRGGKEGGSLVIDSPDGQVRIDLNRTERGGELVIQSPEGEARFGAGPAAEAFPSWFPREGSMPTEPRHVYSARSDEGALGAVAWKTDRSADEVMAFYAERLEELGFESADQRYRDEGGERQSSLWAKDGEGRVAFVVVAEANGRTSVLLGYGEQR